MENFKEKFEEAVQIRTEIQDVFRVEYNDIKKKFEKRYKARG